LSTAFCNARVFANPDASGKKPKAAASVNPSAIIAFCGLSCTRVCAGETDTKRRRQRHIKLKLFIDFFYVKEFVVETKAEL
jgi:hypothetical protein